MSDYTEHLISMAGGDGGDAELRRELRLIKATLALVSEYEALQETVRTQQATLDRVLNLANTSGRCGWRISADDLRKTLRGES